MRAKRIVRGATAGIVATLAHTAVMAVAKNRGWLGEPPPKKITRALLSHIAPNTDEAELDVATAVMHLGFGAAMGALYASVLERPSVASGLLFGSTVWLVSYVGWVPAFGIMPMPEDDRRGRPSAMIVAHWAFGAALALMLRRLTPRVRCRARSSTSSRVTGLARERGARSALRHRDRYRGPAQASRDSITHAPSWRFAGRPPPP